LLTYDIYSTTPSSRKDNTISTTITALVMLLMLVLGLNRWNLGFEQERVIWSCILFEEEEKMGTWVGLG